MTMYEIREAILDELVASEERMMIKNLERCVTDISGNEDCRKLLISYVLKELVDESQVEGNEQTGFKLTDYGRYKKNNESVLAACFVNNIYKCTRLSHDEVNLKEDDIDGKN